ncbi:hypothetical protein COT97_01005 [Candidatus Falkowbacteria bacterium CG10_big_fil_rev_8_21_14_0_10_39_11]|uniref:Lipoprotein n=1 Tax=Candidatus Falkowbacteria bacterium CG10_big_fil_rev_8_21_14_0_10_39_11 TaxID=1974565 RepID=A0A2H0V5W4_9BACT|nr:MAG: hypothetical protein COT97_01005 [Candidatus Falkowbacteria bacterium CG10_big_fil_rev_8_21_14_0_10_39_11]
MKRISLIVVLAALVLGGCAHLSSSVRSSSKLESWWELTDQGRKIAVVVFHSDRTYVNCYANEESQDPDLMFFDNYFLLRRYICMNVCSTDCHDVTDKEVSGNFRKIEEAKRDGQRVCIYVSSPLVSCKVF